MSTHFEMWAIYRHPKDYPDSFVARLWHIVSGELQATEQIFVAPTLEEIRLKLPYGLTRLPRDRRDDPVIVETWI